MQAIILAAGMGRRLKELTRDNTKCMVKVNGVTLIERALRQLDRLGLSRIVIVVGYKGRELIDYIATLRVGTEIVFVDNPIYDRTNNIYSLALARDWLVREDTLLMESDIICEDAVLDELVKDPRKTLALVDRYESWMDGTVVKLDDDDNITDFIPGSKFEFADIPYYYKTVNIYKFGREFSEKYYVPFLEAYCRALGNNEYYEQVLKVITMIDEPMIKAKPLSGQKWYEIDDIQDLDIASGIFIDDDSKVEALADRYGGYWRYPKLRDFCYLVNPYYPPRRLLDEIEANMGTLITQYPSGMRVNSMLAAKDFGVHPEHIVVGNGAAELIKGIIEHSSGRIGLTRPTFEEYPNRAARERIAEFDSAPLDFRYGAGELIGHFDRERVETLILINPDNPSGNYIPKADVLRLAGWAERSGTRLILDESFADFASEESASLISEETIKKYPHLVIIKSISKSYGVPGLRLGILVSGDEALVSFLKKDVAIWNINSIAEFYLQIAEKYGPSYAEALRRLKKARAELASRLAATEGLRVYPSEANYMMIELYSGITAAEMTQRLLTGHGVLVKDLSGKIDLGDRQFLRVAVRNREDNEFLAAALAEELEKGGLSSV